MMKQIQIFLITFVFFLSSSCSNIFLGTANKTTDEALYEEALKAVDKSDYDSAIASIVATSAAFQAQDRVRRTLAGAYAGKCGLDFASYMASFNGASSQFINSLVMAWSAKTTSRAHCRLAEDTMKLISPTYLTRNASDAFFMFFLGAVKAGVYLKELTDANSDGVPLDNPPYDGSNTTTNPGAGSFCDSANISDANIAEAGTGISMMIANLTALGGSVTGVTLDLSAVTTACGALNPNPCLIEDETTISGSAGALLLFRTLFNNLALAAAGSSCP